MDITDYVVVPNFQNANAYRRKLVTWVGVAAALYLLEQHNGSVSRGLRSLKRGFLAALNAWTEEAPGVPLSTPNGKAPTPFKVELEQERGGQAVDNISVRALPSPLYGRGDTPQFFQSTKFFACLDVEEARDLFKNTVKVHLPKGEVLFRCGDPSNSGIFIVVEGQLGVFLPEVDPDHDIHTNTLRYGESVGDLDIIDGAARSVTCRALDMDCLLVQVPRHLFLNFVLTHPRALMLYLQQAMARLWRVAHFVLSDFLDLPPDTMLRTENTSGRQKTCEPMSGVAASTEGMQDCMKAVEGLDEGHSQQQAEGSREQHGQQQLPGKLPEGGAQQTRREANLSPARSVPDMGGPVKGIDSNHGPQRAPGPLTAEDRPVACQQEGWDVMSPNEHCLKEHEDVWDIMTSREGLLRNRFTTLKQGEMLQSQDQVCGQFYVLLEGTLHAQRARRKRGDRCGGHPGSQPKAPGSSSSPLAPEESALILPGSMISCAAFLSSTATRHRITAGGSCVLLAFNWHSLDNLLGLVARLVVTVLLEAGRSLRPVIRRFICLGLNRVWLKSGEIAFHQGESADRLYVIISGRVRLLHESFKPGSTRRRVKIEEELGRGEALGAVWALTGGIHDTTALCVRDSELVRMSRSAFQVVAAEAPTALSRLLEHMAKRLVAAQDARRRQPCLPPPIRGGTTSLGPLPPGLKSLRTVSPGVASSRGENVTIALVPAGTYQTSSFSSASTNRPQPSAAAAVVAAISAVKRLSSALKAALQEYGPVLLLNSTGVRLLFPGAFEKMDVLFYRSKVTSWMAAQEEEYKFILLEADAGVTPWSSVCISQSDCVLLVAPEGASPTANHVEEQLVWCTSRVGAQKAPGDQVPGSTALFAAPQSSQGHPGALKPERSMSTSTTGSFPVSGLMTGTGPDQVALARAPATSLQQATPADVTADQTQLGASNPASGRECSESPKSLLTAALSSMKDCVGPGTSPTVSETALGLITEEAQVGLQQAPLEPAEDAQSGATSRGSRRVSFEEVSIRSVQADKASENLASAAEGARTSPGAMLQSTSRPIVKTISMKCLQTLSPAASLTKPSNQSPRSSDGDNLLGADPDQGQAVSARAETDALKQKRVLNATSPTGPGRLSTGKQGAEEVSALETSGTADLSRGTYKTDDGESLSPGQEDMTHGAIPDTSSRGAPVSQSLGNPLSLQPIPGEGNPGYLQGTTTSAPSGGPKVIVTPPAAAPLSSGVAPRSSSSDLYSPSFNPPPAIAPGSPGHPRAPPPVTRRADMEGDGEDPVAVGTGYWAQTPSAFANSQGTPRPPDAIPHSGVGNEVLPGAPSMSSISCHAPEFTRRVELVLLHSNHVMPLGTIDWLESRPLLTRHHHVRLSQPKDLARLARWMAGRAVGLVLTGGGSRGLAHLGVLCALDDLGIPVDVVGGTSQGAFMAALYAQGLPRDTLHRVVRDYASLMGSMRHLLSDLTLPVLSIFSGRALNAALHRAFAHGPSRVEDLWLPFFCVSTNLTKGEASIHTRGVLWRVVRASMTIVGLLPPVSEDGNLLVDGGYLNNIPVDVVRDLGAETVVVVDVEDKDSVLAGGLWKSLTPYDGGVSGWRLLWDRLCPVPGWRSSQTKLPRYAQIVSQLTWMTHAHNLKKVSEEYGIDLYLRPPNIGHFKLMDYHLAERIVRDSYRYAWARISEWQAEDRLDELHVARPSIEASGSGTAGADSASSPCMTRLQEKQKDKQEKGAGGRGPWQSFEYPVPAAQTSSARGEALPVSHLNFLLGQDMDPMTGVPMGRRAVYDTVTLERPPNPFFINQGSSSFQDGLLSPEQSAKAQLHMLSTTQPSSRYYPGPQPIIPLKSTVPLGPAPVPREPPARQYRAGAEAHLMDRASRHQAITAPTLGVYPGEVVEYMQGYSLPTGLTGALETGPLVQNVVYPTQFKGFFHTPGTRYTSTLQEPSTSVPVGANYCVQAQPYHHVQVLNGVGPWGTSTSSQHSSGVGRGPSLGGQLEGPPEQAVSAPIPLDHPAYPLDCTEVSQPGGPMPVPSACTYVATPQGLYSISESSKGAVATFVPLEVQGSSQDPVHMG